MTNNKVLDELENNGDRMHQVLLAKEDDMEINESSDIDENYDIIEKVRNMVDDNARKLKKSTKARNHIREYIRQNLDEDIGNYSENDIDEAINKEIDNVSERLKEDRNIIIKILSELKQSSRESILRMLNGEASKSEKIVIFGCTFTSATLSVGGISGVISGSMIISVLSMLLFGTTFLASSLAFGLHDITDLNLNGISLNFGFN